MKIMMNHVTCGFIRGLIAAVAQTHSQRNLTSNILVWA